MCEFESLLQNVEDLRDIAWQYSNKYRYDPHFSKIHCEYLEMLKSIINHAKESRKVI